MGGLEVSSHGGMEGGREGTYKLEPLVNDQSSTIAGFFHCIGRATKLHRTEASLPSTRKHWTTCRHQLCVPTNRSVAVWIINITLSLGNRWSLGRSELSSVNYISLPVWLLSWCSLTFWLILHAVLQPQYPECNKSGPTITFNIKT